MAQQLGVSKVTTLTNTYDHRIITGAESGEFLRRIHNLLLGNDELLRRRVREPARCRTNPARWNPTAALKPDPASQFEKVVQVHSLINMYRVPRSPHRQPRSVGPARAAARTPSSTSDYDLSIWDPTRVPRRQPRRRTPAVGDAAPRHPRCGCVRDSLARSASSTCHPGPDQKEWIQRARGGPPARRHHREKHWILERLHGRGVRALPSHEVSQGKRFSLEARRRHPSMLDALSSEAARQRDDRRGAGYDAPRPAQRALAGELLGKSYRTDLPGVQRVSSTRIARRAPAT